MSDEPVAINAKQLGGCTGRGFMPGVSGNPSGRPSIAKKLREMAQDEAGGALMVLVSIRDDLGAKPAERIAAANAILDRAVGKPTQPVSGTDDPDKPQLPSIAVSFVRADSEE